MSKADKYFKDLKIVIDKEHKEKVKNIIFQDQKEQKKNIFPVFVRSFSLAAAAALVLIIFTFVFNYLGIFEKRPMVAMKIEETEETKEYREKKVLQESRPLRKSSGSLKEAVSEKESIIYKTAQEPISSVVDEEIAIEEDAKVVSKSKKERAIKQDSFGAKSSDGLQDDIAFSESYKKISIVPNTSFETIQKIIENELLIKDVKEEEVLNYFGSFDKDISSKNIYVEGTNNFDSKTFLMIYIKPAVDITGPLIEIYFNENIEIFNVIGYSKTNNKDFVTNNKISNKENAVILIEILQKENTIEFGKVIFKYKEKNNNEYMSHEIILNNSILKSFENTSVLFKKLMLGYVISMNIKFNSYNRSFIKTYINDNFTQKNVTLNNDLKIFIDNYLNSSE